MRYRQVHLDFHTSQFIPDIGIKFNRKKWQDTLQKAAVDSITLFASCHHGYSYYDTEVGYRHPGLDFDLLRGQVDACREIGIKTPVYLTAGVNNHISALNPGWGQMNFEGKVYNPLKAHFHLLCFNSPYLDYLCLQIREVVTMFPEADGIFLDIITQNQCCCPRCLAGMKSRGLDPEVELDRKKYARLVLINYYKKATEAVRSRNPEMRVFHNSGHVSIHSEEILQCFSHLELESLPTGGWGYDHYPMSAAYCRNLGKEFLGMTGKFHSMWGEFGGFKSPEALRYECAAMVASGSKCSIGDQLHPDGALNESTYEIIGQAYREIEQKEAWCDHAVSAANLAVLSGFTPEKSLMRGEMPGDTGAARMLLESHIPFDFVDSEMDFDKYKYLVLPDDVRLSSELNEKLEKFLNAGGKLILSGCSGMAMDEDKFLLDISCLHDGCSEYSPDYVKAAPGFEPECISDPFVMYKTAQLIKVENGKSIGKIYDPYFNRTYDHFCSHQHTPHRNEPSGYDAGVITDKILYFAHPVFTIYREHGAVIHKQFTINAICEFMKNDIPIETTLPSQGRISLMYQPEKQRYILHLLYANMSLRGGTCRLPDKTTEGEKPVEVIEDLPSLHNVKIKARLPDIIRDVKIVPENTFLEFTENDREIIFTIPSFSCHCMVELGCNGEQ